MLVVHSFCQIRRLIAAKGIINQPEECLSSKLSTHNTCFVHPLFILLMGSKQEEKVVWTQSEVSSLLDFLSGEKAKGQMTPTGNFKAQTWRAAAGVIQPLHTLGLAKSEKSCKNKWQTVCYK